jgi:uncharacterized GH25 family protein/formylmethanofuran dehydrogenase subunit E
VKIVKRTWLIAVIFLAAAGAAPAHDSWLIADKSCLNDGENLWLSFVTGEVFPMGEVATAPQRVDAFVDIHKGVRREITGYAPKDLGLSLISQMRDGGIHLIGCSLKPKTILMTPEKFEAYLREERAEKAVTHFKSNPTTDERVQELYTKFTKTIIEVAPADENDQGFLTPVGHRLEIVPLTNPCRWKVGEEVQVKVLLDGHPWPDLPLTLGHEGLAPHEAVQETKTDALGLATIKLSKAGHGCLLSHFIRPTDALGRCQWESFWASLSFRVIGATDVGGELQAIRAIHGAIDPWAVAGYRMGRMALKSFGLPDGSNDFLVVHRAPDEAPYPFIADGIQASTKASLGRMTLRLESANVADEIETTFSRPSTGERIVVRLKDGFAFLLQELAAEDQAEAALRVCTLTDEDMFDIAATDVPLASANDSAKAALNPTAAASR